MTAGPVRRILFVGWTRVGDAVMSTVALGHLLDAHPEARITLVCGPLAREVLAPMPRLERLIVLTKKPWNRHWIELVRDLIGSRWDLVVDLRDSAVSYLVRSPRVLRFRKSAEPRRRVDELAMLLGLERPPPPRLWLEEHHHAAAEAVLLGRRPALAVALGAGRPEKLWPVERFAELAGTLAAGGPVLAVGAPGEEPLAARLAELLGPDRVIDVTGRLDLLSQAACVAQARLFVGNDSGFTHVAAALGVPTLAVFGPTDPRQYAPFGPIASHIGGSTGGGRLAMEDIPVAAVERAARSLMASQPPGSSSA